MTDPIRVESPSNKDLLELAKGWSWTTDKSNDLPGSPDMQLFSVFEDELIQFARVVLARWGNQPTPPAKGEVVELVAQLTSRHYGPEALDRAAELLQQQQARIAELEQLSAGAPAVVPVPVWERLPEPTDCDAEGRCWAGTRASMDSTGDRDIDYPPSWEFREVCAQDDEWLPAHALPIPQGEVE